MICKVITHILPVNLISEECNDCKVIRFSLYIAPTRNPATESEQYGMNIVGEIEEPNFCKYCGYLEGKEKILGADKL